MDNQPEKTSEESSTPTRHRKIYRYAVILLVIAALGFAAYQYTDLKYYVANLLGLNDMYSLANASEEDFQQNQVNMYYSQLSLITQNLGFALIEIGNLLSEFNPYGNDAVWTENMAAQITVVKFAVDQAQQLTPPPGCEDIHATFVQSMNKFGEAMDCLCVGIDNNDSSEIEKAQTLMQEGTVLLEDAVNRLEAMRQKSQ